jgi:hypothetical protein
MQDVCWVFKYYNAKLRFDFSKENKQNLSTRDLASETEQNKKARLFTASKKADFKSFPTKFESSKY